MLEQTTKIKIRRSWKHWDIGEAQFSDLDGLKWDVISGGVNARSPQPFVHGYVMCNKIEGEVAHSCRHGSGPHSIKVCIVKKDNDPAVWKDLLEIVGPKPRA